MQIDQQKAEQAQAAHERAALARLDKVKSDQTKRVAALEAEAEAQERRALLIHLNLEAVEGAIAAVNGALAAGMDWGELEAMIRAEKRAGNPVASIIGSLALDRNKVCSAEAGGFPRAAPPVAAGAEQCAVPAWLRR